MKAKIKFVTASTLMACALMGVTAAHAENRALLIGVGKYAKPADNLSGIDLDLASAKDIARGLGFQESQIHTLLDEQATLKGVRGEIQNWLSNGAQPDDRVLLYYSGHGSQIPDENGDEDDGVDEVLVLHDADRVVRNGRATLGGVLVDDEIGELLRTIKSKNVMVFIDACRSGTITKGLRAISSGSSNLFAVEDGQAKALIYEGMPSKGQTDAGRPSFAVKGNFGTSARDDNYVALTATTDSQNAIATPKGSIFTLALHQAIGEATHSGKALTPKELRDLADGFIVATLSEQRRFKPSLAGSARLIESPLPLNRPEPGAGPVWAELEQVAMRIGETFEMKANRSEYDTTKGQALELTMNIPVDGYLNIINVGPDDAPTVLFPNSLHSDNHVGRGTITLPTSAMSFDWTPQAPVGPALVVAFVTQQPVDLFKTAIGSRDGKGKMKDVFGELSPAGRASMRAFGVSERKGSSVYAAKIELTVK